MRCSYLLNFGSARSNELTRNDGGRSELSLMGLPSEILLCVSVFLPVKSLACFCLCNHRLFSILSTTTLKGLSECDESERAGFLGLLAEYLPQHFFCHQCCRLHHKGKLEPPDFDPWIRRALPCVEDAPSLRHDSPYITSDYRLKFPHVQLAMKRHRRGPNHGISLDEVSFTELKDYTSSREEITTLLSAEARIISDQLLVRVQQWTLVPQDKCDEFVARATLADLCPHKKLRYQLHREVSARVECRLRHLRGSEEPSNCCKGSVRCSSCAMEFQIDVRDFGERGTALVVTKWLNLGSGLTPLDQRWRKHVVQSGLENYMLEEPPDDGVCLSFERAEGRPVDALTQHNATLLFGVREWRGEWSGYYWHYRKPAHWVLRRARPAMVAGLKFCLLVFCNSLIVQFCLSSWRVLERICRLIWRFPTTDN